MRVLLVDDDTVERKANALVIERSRAKVLACATREATKLASLRPFDVIAANTQFGLVRDLRQRGDWTPYVAYGASDQSDHHRATALEAGASLTFESPLVYPRAFCAQLATLALSHKATTQPGEVVVGAISIDGHSRVVSVHGKPVKLTRQDYEILTVLARRVGTLVSHDQLATLLGRRYGAASHAIQEAIVRLRKHLGVAAGHIVTEYGFGVRLEAVPCEARSGVRLRGQRASTTTRERSAAASAASALTKSS